MSVSKPGSLNGSALIVNVAPAGFSSCLKTLLTAQSIA
jgi:hypothetical protein